jgi:hypothetical protein
LAYGNTSSHTLKEPNDSSNASHSASHNKKQATA